ncbi:MAG: multicopper oxidase domain-containing protein [Gammaproteobacteria bacterium]|nr:multicopper oxidase domain-containing protein [Gammaproteobacteria bacterium]MDP2142159.1 multicopper oxidase domain-containing protein [Gammaproteobacteria bacterium]MDP2348233.1 multicopper oxidase domain-containing protein [Gammaproteobacteria bacterium]
MAIDRRKFVLGLGSGGLLLAGSRHLLAADHRMLLPATATPGFDPDIELELVAEPGVAEMLQGQRTSIWRYSGSVLKGNDSSLTWLDGSGYLPVIRVHRGQKLRIHFTNNLPEASIVHWHGLHMPQPMDGHPMYAIDPGSSFVYEFTVDTRAGTYWFHPHPHQRTGFQVYQGLAGLFLVHDDEEDAAHLPPVERELPLVLQDRSFDAQGQLVYLGGMRHDYMMGFSGQRVLVNGVADYQREVARTAHRVRLFNGSNATLYHLRWSDNRPLVVIGTDGGLLEHSISRNTLTLGVGERADVWVDFSDREPGASVSLLAESYSPSLVNFTAQQRGAPLQDDARAVATFTISSGAATPVEAPQMLSRFPALVLEEAVNGNNPRSIRISMGMGSAMLNNRTFGAMDEVADDDRVRLGTTEVWEFANDASMGMGMGGRGGGMGGMMSMAHPMHVHNVQFRVLSRTRNDRADSTQQRLSEGFTDFGLKDVVLVLPGERVRVLMSFQTHTGIYLYHCHILEHEDLGMMRNFLIEA